MKKPIPTVEEIWKKWENIVYKKARNVTQNREDIEDIVGEFLVKLCTHWEKLDETRSSPDTFFDRILQSSIASWLKKQQARKRKNETVSENVFSAIDYGTPYDKMMEKRVIAETIEWEEEQDNNE